MSTQMSKFFDNILSKEQCGFRKGFNTQYCILKMIEKWLESRDKGGRYGALFTDLSKSFDCLIHELLIAKLHDYGFDLKLLNILHSSLTGRQHRTIMKNSFSLWHEILFGVPQGSILGPLLFNIYLCDFFILLT